MSNAKLYQNTMEAWAEFLDTSKVYNDTYTHLSLNGGKYCINTGDKRACSNFYKIYNKSINEGTKIYLAERNIEQSLIYIDIDINNNKYTSMNVPYSF